MYNEYRYFYVIYRCFHVTSWVFCSVSSLMLLVYPHFTSETDIPFVQLNEKWLGEGTQTLIMITWKPANLSREQFESLAYTGKTSVLDFDGTDPRSSAVGAL